MIVKYDNENEEYYIKEKISSQTMRMAFTMVNWSDDTIHFNIYLTLYNKRGQIASNEAEAKSTGENPVKTFFVARKAFWILLNEVIYRYNDRYDLVIYCCWLDNRRREVYKKFLTPLGFRYGIIDNEKCLFKRYRKGTANV